MFTWTPVLVDFLDCSSSIKSNRHPGPVVYYTTDAIRVYKREINENATATIVPVTTT